MNRTAPANSNSFPWINPVGGIGDTLMLSSVLKRVHEMDSERRFMLVRRTGYNRILDGHPVILGIGNPPMGAEILSMTYWSHPNYGKPGYRAFQLLGEMFGLPLPVKEELYLPGEPPDVSWWKAHLPWRKLNVLIAPSSASPRKQMHPARWHYLVDRLQEKDVFVVQAGGPHDIRIRNAYSLLGLTTPRELIGLLGCFDLVVTVDNFVMHAAHLVGVDAIVLWGPTDHRVYGYAEHRHFQVERSPGCECIGPSRPELYNRQCPLQQEHCLDQLDLEDVLRGISNVLCDNRRSRIS